MDPSIAAAALFLLSLCPALLAPIHGRPEPPPPLIQLPRSGDHWARGLVSVDEFGAKGNGVDDDSMAFQRAWDYACSSRQSLEINFPAENAYLIGPIGMGGPCKSKMRLSIEGTIVAPSDPEAWDGLNPQKWIYFHGVKQMVIHGGGTIDGMGQKWWSRSCKSNTTNPCRHAPTAITFHRCKHVLIHDLNVLNSQQMHIAITSCSHVRASRLKVIAPAESPNTDGIHVSGSHSIRVEDSRIETGDDCISIVRNSSKVRVKNITCGPGHGISIGSLGKSNSYSQVHSVSVESSLLLNTENGVRIKTWQGGHGYARKIVFRDIQMRNVSNPIIIDQYYCDSLRKCQNQTASVKVQKISFIRIKGTSATQEAMTFSCSDSSPCEKIYLEDIVLSAGSGGRASASCWKASGFSSGVISPPSCLSSAEKLAARIDQHGSPSKEWPSLHQRWEGFLGERAEGQKPLFAVRRSSIFGHERSGFAVEVRAGGGGGEEAKEEDEEEEYRIEGSFAQRCCRVFYEGGGGESVTVAEIKRKVDACSHVVLGRDVFSLCLRPRCDAAFAMGLVIVLDQISGDADDVVLEEQVVAASVENPAPIMTS